MRGKRKLKVHWVNGVGKREVENKTDQTTKQEKPRHNNKNPLNQTIHQNQSTTPESGEEDKGLNRRFKRGVKDKGIVLFSTLNDASFFTLNGAISA